MSVLSEIISNKLKEVDERSVIVPLSRLKDTQRLFSMRDFKQSLLSDSIQVIAEIKKRSPSNNSINLSADPLKIAASYQKNGACSISVLTDQKYFGGHIDLIRKVKNITSVPILRKDFIVSEYQVWESFYCGADAILLIVDAIDYQLLVDLYQLAKELDLHVLVESHSIESLNLINNLKPEIVGINCRNLKTMETDIKWFEEVFDMLPSSAIKIAESGVSSVDDLLYISSLGYNAALIGTSLMSKGSNPGNILRDFLRKVSI
tara:strand:+ start:278 stop:1063 length:786 start_codon:yes stop_codon:yes gene_type:complete